MAMTTTLATAFSLALGSGLASAVAHALMKSGRNKLATQAWVRICIAMVAVPAVFWVGLPPADMWGWIAAALAAHLLYNLTLIWTYSLNDFSASYPIARGVAPIITTLAGISVLGDRLSALALIGIAIVGAGIIALADARAVTRIGLIAALCAGAMASAYTLVDAAGMRAASDVWVFIVWLFALDGISMPALLFLRYGREGFALLRQDLRTGITAGLISPFAFAPVLLALRMAPAGAVSALRETSVLFGVVLGRVMLKEQVDGRRIGGAVLVMVGTLLIIAQTLF
jgi:drug/metabolite transporter (DMT)-like permease